MIYTVFYKTSSFAGYCFPVKNSIHFKWTDVLFYGIFYNFGKISNLLIYRKKIKLREDKTVWFANAFVGKLLLKELCDIIFIPIDNNAEYIEKDKCYKIFHILVEYFENRGYNGIHYPSTRMKLDGKMRRDIVLFDADSAEEIE